MRTILCLCLVVLACASPSSDDLKPTAWQAPLGRDHSLVGKIWEPAGERFIPASRLIERSKRARFVLLGEKHDNPDHHRLQAWLIRALAQSGDGSIVAFEMFTPEQGPLIESHLRAHPGDAAGLAEAVGWDHSGWPDWELYEPIVEAALAMDLSIRPANLSGAELAGLRKTGTPG